LGDHTASTLQKNNQNSKERIVIMGSLFSPSVPTYSPVSYTPAAIQTSPQPQQNESPETQQNTQTDSNEEDVVKDIIKRNTRGRSSLIQTSYRGVLGEASAPTAPQRKSLLGE
jgi:hypothetical protein